MRIPSILGKVIKYCEAGQRLVTVPICNDNRSSIIWLNTEDTVTKITLKFTLNRIIYGDF